MPGVRRGALDRHASREFGKHFGNGTIRVTPDGEMSIKPPAPLAHPADSKHGRYIVDAGRRRLRAGCDPRVQRAGVRGTGPEMERGASGSDR
ncbi:hypothetical protein FNX48_002955 [Streptomyces sp. IF17]|nr:hypothetical protein [Streptomyces alkaliphilus]